MKNKAFIVAVLFIAGSWLVLQFTQIHFRHRTTSRRHKAISIRRNEIEKIKESINKNIDESISKKDLLNITEINELEGLIGGLRMENAIDRSRGPENTIPEFFLIILLVAISMKIGVIDKKYRMNFS
ncbi:MAG: hypothetical protein GY845_32030 [Planctomycetes bacterium]|nr:hypothetical protein [Planctomycetota bacterium]